MARERGKDPLGEIQEEVPLRNEQGKERRTSREGEVRTRKRTHWEGAGKGKEEEEWGTGGKKEEDPRETSREGSGQGLMAMIEEGQERGLPRKTSKRKNLTWAPDSGEIIVGQVEPLIAFAFKPASGGLARGRNFAVSSDDLSAMDSKL
jgi:hypothetical protein